MTCVVSVIDLGVSHTRIYFRELFLAVPKLVVLRKDNKSRFSISTDSDVEKNPVNVTPVRFHWLPPLPFPPEVA